MNATDEYTPTTVQVRESFIYAQLAVRGLPTNSIGGMHPRAFDRWLVEHDRQVKAGAWDEGHSAGHDDFVGNDGTWPTTTNPYRAADIEAR